VLPTNVVGRHWTVRLAGFVELALQKESVASLTWLPEAAVPFFKGMEYYARERTKP
jgi:hypothetical protein